MGNFGRGPRPYEEHLCQILLNLSQQLRRCCSKIFLALMAILFGNHNVTVWTILMEAGPYEEHLCQKIFRTWASSSGDIIKLDFKDVYTFKL